MHTWTSSPFASTAGNRAVGECSSIACWKMPSQHSQRDIGLQEPTKQHQNTTCSGYCTKAATPLCKFRAKMPTLALQYPQKAFPKAPLSQPTLAAACFPPQERPGGDASAPEASLTPPPNSAV